MDVDEKNSQSTVKEMQNNTPAIDHTDNIEISTLSNRNTNNTISKSSLFDSLESQTSDEEKNDLQEEKGDSSKSNELEEESIEEVDQPTGLHQQQVKSIDRKEERKNHQHENRLLLSALRNEEENDNQTMSGLSKDVESDETVSTTNKFDYVYNNNNNNNSNNDNKNNDNNDSSKDEETHVTINPISSNSNDDKSTDNTEHAKSNQLNILQEEEEKKEAEEGLSLNKQRKNLRNGNFRRFSPRMSCSIDFVRNTLEEENLFEDTDKEETLSPRSPVSLSSISSPTESNNAILKSSKHQPKISFNLINERGKELKIITDVDRSSETMIIMDVRKSSISNADLQKKNSKISPNNIEDKRSKNDENKEDNDKRSQKGIRKSISRLSSLISNGGDKLAENNKEMVVIIDERHHDSILSGSPKSRSISSDGSISSDSNDNNPLHFDGGHSSMKADNIQNTENLQITTIHTPLHKKLHRLSMSGANTIKKRKEKEDEETEAYGKYNHFQEYNIYKLQDEEFYTEPKETEIGIELSPRPSPRHLKQNDIFDPTKLSVQLQTGSDMNQASSSPSHNYHQTINKIQSFPLINHVVEYVARKRGHRTYYRAGMSSQNYENDESEVARLYALNKYGDTLEEKEILRRTRIRSFARWTLLAIIAILIDIMYMFITISSQALLLLKEMAIAKVESPLSKYFLYIGFSLLYSSLAFLCVYYAPLCAGSGIPETKAFLNGIRIPYMHSLRTLIGKVAGTIFSVASGLPVGKYGPMIHIGSIIAANISKLARSTLAFGQFFDVLRAFSSHAEKRDLVVAGTAAGVTAAFNAPVGGLLLAWEESSSYWNLKVSWRVFFCTMTAVIFTFFVINSHEIDDTSYLRFLKISFLNTAITEDSLHVWTQNIDLVLFIGLGVAGGLLGAFYVECHKIIARYRDKMVKYGYLFQYLQVVFVTIIVTTVSVASAWLSQSWSCKKLPNITAEMIGPSSTPEMVEFYQTQHLLLRFTCPEGTYNEVASLVLNAGADTLKLLYHMPSVNPLDENELMFSFSALCVVSIPYFFLLLLTFGIAIPSGFFVPQLVAGGLLGRMLVTFIKVTWSNSTHSSLQVYALMGSAAFIGGVSRMLLSMTLMLVEATGKMQLLVPFAIILIVTRWVGNHFNQGIFETIISMKGYPVLKADPPKWALRHGRAGDLANTNLVTVYPIETSERLVEILTKTTHHLFPVVYPPGHKNEGLVYGTVMREVLIIILKTHSLSKSKDVDTSVENPNIISPVICFTAQQKFEGQLSTEEMERPIFTLGGNAKGHYADLRPYVNRSLYLINRGASLSKIYNLFRGVGLRHLLVIDEFNQNRLYGILTRHDLVPENIRKKYTLEEMEKRKGESPYWTLPQGIRNKIHLREANLRRKSESENGDNVIFEARDSGNEFEDDSWGLHSPTSSDRCFKWWKREDGNQSGEILSSMEEGGRDNKEI